LGELERQAAAERIVSRLERSGVRFWKADPAAGRFLSPDPLGYVDGPNLYSYVLNDPVNNVDPLGLACEAQVGSRVRRCYGGDGGRPTITADGGGGGGGRFCYNITVTQGGSSTSGVGCFSRDLGDSFRFVHHPNAITVTAPRPTREPFDFGRPFPVRGGGEAFQLDASDGASAEGTPHNYRIYTVAQCSADDSFALLRTPGVSAPGAPYAKEGVSSLTLLGNNGSNRIFQVVSPSARTITNITREGHEFHPGTVKLSVGETEKASFSTVTAVGYGTGPRPIWNSILGAAFFAHSLSFVQKTCRFR
jgi:RHS repeat-associated protein